MRRGNYSFILLVLVFLESFVNDYALCQQSTEGAELIGKIAPEFIGLIWLNHEPITLEGLRGKTVLIRFWSSDCTLCDHSASAINYLHKKYKQRGLVVIGIHHPKSEEAKDIGYVKLAAKRLGFQFPIAQDTEWKTINLYWLSGKTRKYTSASFLIDHLGKFSLVHEGGVLSLNSSYGRAKDSLDRTIDRLLKNKDRMNSGSD